MWDDQKDAHELHCVAACRLNVHVSNALSLACACWLLGPETDEICLFFFFFLFDFPK